MKSLIKNCSKYLLILSSLAVTLASCSNHKFKIKGEIYGAEEKSIVLEKPDFHGKWVSIDSVRTNKNGGFSISFPSPLAPEIYRLSLNKQYIYIPVDSTETITVTSSYDKFGNDFALTGSRNAEMMEKFEKDLQAFNSTDPDSIRSFKRNIYSNYIKDARASVLSFYILTKTVNGKPLYSPSDRDDHKYFGAVATGYKELRPDDPHTTLLEQTVIQSIKQQNNIKGNYRQLEAEEISMIDIDLQDETGKFVKLSDIAGHGKPVVVIFSILNHPDSPQLNIDLAKIYNRLAGKVEFYNVSLDSDQYTWREAAKNLPWITVYSPGEGSSQDAIRYNAYQIPSFYIYNANGELTDRPMTLQELNKAL